ncbi:sensor histidine kinase [Kitasatospora sp. NPDC101183]|uniref:sensor histidine kinase n=1 Tax=Kitasatospora sp. NPDC101183 TaxID=3364100 RepID=UPI0038259E01
MIIGVGARRKSPPVGPGGGEDEAVGSRLRLEASELPAPVLARTITVFTLFCFGLLAVANVSASGQQGRRFAAFTVCIGLTFVIQLVNSSPRVRRWSLRRRVVSLVLQGTLTYVPAITFASVWGGMLGCLAGSSVLLLPRRAGWTTFALIIASTIGLSLAFEHSASPLEHFWNVVYLVQSTALTGLIIYGLTRLSDLVKEVHDSRKELARGAVLQERLRFARDLHDLLGYSLSAITLKAELINRLVGARPDRAKEETVGLLDVSRQALADVRLVASGYRDMSLAAEAESAASTLRAADVHTDVDIDCGRLHPLVDTVLATALREGVTNILRHSKVQKCTISAVVTDAESVTLTLVNDGVVDGPKESCPHSGSGLGNLRSRFEAIGGRVEAGVREGDRFVLTVEAPLRPQNEKGTAAQETTESVVAA